MRAVFFSGLTGRSEKATHDLGAALNEVTSLLTHSVLLLLPPPRRHPPPTATGPRDPCSDSGIVRKPERWCQVLSTNSTSLIIYPIFPLMCPLLARVKKRLKTLVLEQHALAEFT